MKKTDLINKLQTLHDSINGRVTGNLNPLNQVKLLISELENKICLVQLIIDALDDHEKGGALSATTLRNMAEALTQNERAMVTADDIIKAGEKLSASPMRQTRFLVHSLSLWQILREKGEPVAQWTDTELAAFDKKTGLIGNKNGVDCYILLDLKL